MGADVAGQHQCHRVDVDRDDASGGERIQDLDRHVAQAAGADHDRGRAGHQQRQRALDRVVRRQRRIRQRRGFDRVQAAERYEVPHVGHDHVLGHAAIGAEAAARGAELGLVHAVVLEPLHAAVARAAAPRAVHGHRVADLNPRRARPECIDPARVLVSERERGTPGQQSALEVVHQVEIRVAGAGATDADAHLAGARLGVVDVDELRSVLPVDQSQRAHGVISSYFVWTFQSSATRPRPARGIGPRSEERRRRGRDVRL